LWLAGTPAGADVSDASSSTHCAEIGVNAAVGNKAIYLALGCCPTARVRASTHNDVLHWTKR
jgi:hypothetical protein